MNFLLENIRRKYRRTNQRMVSQNLAYKKTKTTVKTTVVHNSSYFFKQLITPYNVC